MFSSDQVFISKTFFTLAVILAAEFANFANSNTHTLAKRHLTGRYNEHLDIMSNQLSAINSQRSAALGSGLPTEPLPGPKVSSSFLRARRGSPLFLTPHSALRIQVGLLTPTKHRSPFIPRFSLPMCRNSPRNRPGSRRKWIKIRAKPPRFIPHSAIPDDGCRFTCGSYFPQIHTHRRYRLRRDGIESHSAPMEQKSVEIE